MTATIKGVTLAAAVALAASAPAWAQDRSDWPANFSVGTASQGGTFFIYGAGWANLVTEKTRVPSSTEATGGPVQNLALVQTRDVDFGMTTMGPARDAWDGNSPIVPGVEFRNVRALFPMYQTPFQVVALQASGIGSIADLDGKRVGVGPRGGTCGTYWPQFFEALGVNVNPQFGGASDLAGQVQDGLIDAFAFCAGLPIAAFAELEAQRPVNIFSFTADEQAALVEAFPVSAFEVPAGIYNSTPEPQKSVAMWNFAIGHKDLSASFVREVMATVLDNHDRMMQIHGASIETLPENYVHNTFLWFHPGAIEYLQDNGFEIDPALFPPEWQG
ncbi:MAG: TAXI family TRAP transporter solute-binding subunit [Geminicoccaceae bacterium]|nr:MAG: TAXI family TRAP transporter solute-binding subunit [Geminicoccaceae bacterium]